jgi:transcriptional regulator with GAF, ATPase, and Fis domain
MIQSGRDSEQLQETSAFIGAHAPSHGNFTALLMDVLARFANCAGGQLENELETSFGRICQFLEIDRAGLWQVCGTESFALQYLYPHPTEGSDGQRTSRPDSPWLCGGFKCDFKSCFPWISTQVRDGRTILFSSPSELPPEAEEDKEAMGWFGAEAGAVMPFAVDGKVLGAMHFSMERPERPWPADLVDRLKLVTQILGNTIVRNIREDQLKKSLWEIKQLKEQLQLESEYLRAEIKLSQPHKEIIGRSAAIKRVLQQVEQAAPVECTVLITGETGTGKELIARAIHRLSSRKDRAMVTVNCAALPAPLIESELFGRERGAYTGALTSQVGRFEVADGSTIFLDEIGELSQDVQGKLLRILQEGEFQRLGNPKTCKVNLRVIAATNRDLAKEVREGRFREDLYYRLGVFPINVPPLRERMEDIPLLVSAFVEELSARMNKQINRIPRKLVEALERHPWPGNIRELRNIVERGVILSRNETLILPKLSDLPESTLRPHSLAEVERDHILKTLADSGWRVKGPYGAANRLQIKPSTLYSRMAKLGVHRVGGKLAPTEQGA